MIWVTRVSKLKKPLAVFFLMSVLAAHSAGPGKDWMLLGESTPDSDGDLYMDMKSIRFENSSMLVSTIFNFKKPTPSGRRNVSAYIRKEFDCANYRLRTREAVFYTQNNAKGEVFSRLDVEPWEPVPTSGLWRESYLMGCDFGKKNGRF